MQKFLHRIRQHEARFPNAHQLARYILIGGSTALLELVAFLVLVEWGLWYLAANIIAFAIAVVYGFFMQRRYTFRHTATDYHKQVVKFLIVVGFGFVLNNALIFLFIDLLNWTPFVSKFLQLWIVMVTNYCGQRWFTFRSQS